MSASESPREVVAQVLDYASWVVGLTTPDLHRIAERYLQFLKTGKTLREAFRETFDQPLPERLNSSHRC